MELHQRKPNRLPYFDYSAPGAYFITICTKDRKSIFWEGVGASIARPQKPVLTSWGRIVDAAINKIPSHYPAISLDHYVVMPNHIHGIIIIKNSESIENPEKKYAFQIVERRGRRSLQGLIKDFKSVTTRYYKNTYNKTESLWQESFYDTVITSQEQYENICNYILCNPLNWLLKKDLDDF